MTVPSTYKLGYPGLKYSTVPSVTLDQDPTASDLYHPTVGGSIQYPLYGLINQQAQHSFL